MATVGASKEQQAEIQDCNNSLEQKSYGSNTSSNSSDAKDLQDNSEDIHTDDEDQETSKAVVVLSEIAPLEPAGYQGDDDSLVPIAAAATASTTTSSWGAMPVFALTMQLEHMQQMHDWMIVQKEQECAQLRERLKDFQGQILDLRVQNAHLNGKISLQKEHIRHEVELLKMACSQLELLDGLESRHEDEVVQEIENLHEIRDESTTPLKEVKNLASHSSGDKSMATLTCFEKPRTLMELEICRIECIIRNCPGWWTLLHSLEKVEEWRSRAQATAPVSALSYPPVLKQKVFEYAIAECHSLAYQYLGPTRPAAVDNVFARDDMQESLLSSLLDSIHRLREMPAVGAQKEDRHPKSPQMVHLVHPSLYCYEKGKTGVLPSNILTFQDMLCRQGVPLDTNADGASLSQLMWLPSEFWVSSAEGDKLAKCEINSYINSLHPEEHSDLYESLQELFVHCVPVLEEALADRNENGSLRERPFRVSPGGLVPDFKPPTNDDGGGANRRTRLSLYDRPLQVFVKIVSLEIEPGDTYDGGWWHVEGINEERIIATACCYLQAENVQGGELEFRTPVQAPFCTNQSDGSVVSAMYGLKVGDLLVQPRGHCNVYPGRVLAWSNTLQHRVRPARLVDPSQRGRRVSCCFNLVDPSCRVRSTSTVPPQQHAWLAKEIDSVLKSSIPDRLLRTKISNLLVSSRDCLTYEQACLRRQRLLELRSSEHEDGFAGTRSFRVGRDLDERASAARFD